MSGGASRRPRLVLASGSPRRQAMLRDLGLAFEVRPVDVDETPRPGEDPEAYVLRLARAKAYADRRSGELVLAADTIVVLEGELLGKPADASEARSMLRRLAGRDHTVLTGVALDAGDRERASVASTRVTLARLTAEEIGWYVDTGEPLDKAGAYAIQGLGSLYVERISGNYSNVVGLPLPAVYRLFAELGHDLLAFRNGAEPELGAEPVEDDEPPPE